MLESCHTPGEEEMGSRRKPQACQLLNHVYGLTAIGQMNGSTREARNERILLRLFPCYSRLRCE